MIRKKKIARRPGRPSKAPAKRKFARKYGAVAAAPRRVSKPKPKHVPARVVRVDPESLVPAVAPVLSAKRRRELRGDAHALEPLVLVGHGGITEAVVQAVSRALLDHELIKVRFREPEDKRGMAEQLATEARAALCGLVGHTVILYREKPKQKGISGVARSAIKRNRKKGGRP